MSDQTAIVSTDQNTALAAIGQIANGYAAAGVFDDYRSRRAANTLRRQRADLDLFARFLEGIQHQTTGDELQSSPDAWRGISWGLIQGFVGWMQRQGYAVGSINVRLSTVKKYAALARQAGAISHEEHAGIKAVTGFTHSDGKHMDEQRSAAELPTRKGVKKAESVTLTKQQRHALKHQPDSNQGRRDTLLMCLLLDHGLRCGEVALLKVRDFNLTDGTFTFRRPKVDKVQTHTLTPDALRAARAYFNAGDAPLAADAPLLRSSRKDGSLTAGRMTERAITKRVKTLGEDIGIHGLSAHDCRHSWATNAALHKTPLNDLIHAGGWNSPAMPMRYIDAAKIANQGVMLGTDEPDATP